MTFLDVWFWPNWALNLFSLKKTDQDTDQDIRNNGKMWTFLRDGEPIALAVSREGDLYWMVVRVVIPERTCASHQMNRTICYKHGMSTWDTKISNMWKRFCMNLGSKSMKTKCLDSVMAASRASIQDSALVNVWTSRHNPVNWCLPTFVDFLEVAMMQAQVTITELRTDGGKEFDNSEVRQIMQNVELKHS